MPVLSLLIEHYTSLWKFLVFSRKGIFFNFSTVFGNSCNRFQTYGFTALDIFSSSRKHYFLACCGIPHLWRLKNRTFWLRPPFGRKHLIQVLGVSGPQRPGNWTCDLVLVNKTRWQKLQGDGYTLYILWKPQEVPKP